jgi:hypothetical protein
VRRRVLAGRQEGVGEAGSIVATVEAGPARPRRLDPLLGEHAKEERELERLVVDQDAVEVEEEGPQHARILER